jgi:hypothetical protein
MERNKAKYTRQVNPQNINLTGYRSTFFEGYNFKNVADKQGFYEFGVFSGKSMIEMLNIFNRSKVSLSHVYGFDSFQGIPKCNEEPLWNQVWGEGEFNSCDYLSVEDPKEAAQIICEEVKQSLYSEEQMIKFYEGFYKDTLPTVEKNTLVPALFVDIDVDIYSSAKEALEFLLSNNLIKVGTVINYDDWGGSPSNDRFLTGESRAHKEICDEYSMGCSIIRDNGGQRAYEVTKV